MNANSELIEIKANKDILSEKLQKSQNLINTIQAEIKKIKSDILALEEQERKINEVIQRGEDELNRGEIIITDHAWKRYFERILGYDLEEIRRKIIDNVLIQRKNILGSGVAIANKEGIIFNFINNKVTTISQK